MKKKIFILLVILLLTGCSGKVNIKVTKDNKVHEEIYASEKISNIELAGISKEEFMDLANEAYEVNLINGYNKTTKQIDDNYGILFTKESNDICDAIKTSYFSSFFNSVDCIEEKKSFEIKASSKTLICGEDCNSYDYGIDDITLEIELPEKAISSNAKKEENNKYIWEFKKGEESIVNLTIKKYNIITTKNSKNNIDKENDKENKVVILVIIGLVILVSFLAVVIYDKYKKNKLEY